MGGRTKPQNGNFAPKRRCTLLRLRSARAQRATPARSAAYGDAKGAYFGRFGADFVNRIERSSVGANGQKTRLFEFSILAALGPATTPSSGLQDHMTWWDCIIKKSTSRSLVS